jgi:Predicted membrane protein (DUF2142)
VSTRDPSDTRAPQHDGSPTRERRGERHARLPARPDTRMVRVGPGPAGRMRAAARAALSRTRGTVGRVPRAAWLCAAIAFMNAACWSIVVPPLQSADEPAHFAYTALLAENQELPSSSEYTFSPYERAVMNAMHQEALRGRTIDRAVSTPSEQRTLEEALAAPLSRRGYGGVGGAYSDPPLYYLVQTIPYELASAGTLLDQLALMRLVSALMAALTALFAFLFVRETIPRWPWAWTVGGLCVALTPLLAFASGMVNPDALLFTISAALFYCLARAFRHGLTRRRAVVAGALMAAGLLTKINFIGLVPGVAAALVFLALRDARMSGRARALGSLALAFAIAAAPVVVYATANVLEGRNTLGIVSSTLDLGERRGGFFDELSYLWQFYLPRLPGMDNYFPGLSMTRQVWFDKAVGFYGWLDTSFPLWVDNVALAPATLIALLCVRGLFLWRAALRRHLAELLAYGAMCVGLMALIAASAYYNTEESLGFAEPRYLVPLVPLLAVALAFAALGAGRRWGASVGVVIVVLFLGHDIFSQLLVVGRYYG